MVHRKISSRKNIMTKFSSYLTFLPVFVVVCLMTIRAFSAEKSKTSRWTAAKMFEKKDIDIDGFLSFEEFKHGGNEKFLKTAEKRFQTLDTNQDKKVSLDELKSGWASMTRNKTN